LEPNSFNDLGSEMSVVAREFINPSRQIAKGTVTDLDPKAGWSNDFTRTNLNALLMGFFFADAREWPSTQPTFGTQVPITSVTAGTYVAASGLLPFNVANLLVWAEGFGTSNDGLKVVTSATATAVTAGGTSVQASVPAAAKLTAVGKQFAAGDVVAALSGSIATLASTAAAFPTLLPGSWIAVGGDGAGNAFATCPRGYGRVRTATASLVTLDDWNGVGGAAFVADAGAAKTIQIFFGLVIKNESAAALIKRRTYNLERQLGFSSTGALGMMAQYIEGAVPNEFTLNLPGQDKIAADLTFVGMNETFATGEVGAVIKTGTRVPAPGEDAYNTSTDVRFTKLAIQAAGVSTQVPLFAFATEATIAINNNDDGSKALGVIGNLDANPGNFEVTGSVTAYFDNVPALQSVRNNADVGYSIGVFSAKQWGFILDVPLMQVSGMADVEKDSDVTVPLDLKGCVSKFAHTMLYQYFAYIPAAYVA
jgi:hypothetical protein